jgi:hypothetical protein
MHIQLWDESNMYRLTNLKAVYNPNITFTECIFEDVSDEALTEGAVSENEKATK